MAWQAVIPIAIDLGSSLLGGSSSGRADMDGRVAQVAARAGDIAGMRSELAAGSFTGRPVAEWSKGASSKQRDFFRLVAVWVGAIDAGYRQRGEPGAAQALAAAERWAADADRALGSRMAASVRAQDPAGFTRAFLAVPLDALVPSIPPSPPPSQQIAVGGSTPSAGSAPAGWSISVGAGYETPRGIGGVPVWAIAAAVGVVVLMLVMRR